jgi:hypothetical protein
MANGKPGDHPFADILGHKIEVYGEKADELIRRIGSLSSRRELDEWWEKEIGWTCNPVKALERAKAKYDQLLERAKNSGWEVE